MHIDFTRSGSGLTRHETLQGCDDLQGCDETFLGKKKLRRKSVKLFKILKIGASVNQEQRSKGGGGKWGAQCNSLSDYILQAAPMAKQRHISEPAQKTSWTLKSCWRADFGINDKDKFETLDARRTNLRQTKPCGFVHTVVMSADPS